MPLVDKGEQTLELLLGFAGKTDDEGGAQGHVGDAPADPGEQGTDRGRIDAAVHHAKNRVVDMLQGDVEVLADLLLAGDQLEQARR